MSSFSFSLFLFSFFLTNFFLLPSLSLSGGAKKQHFPKKTWRWLTAPALWLMAFAASQLFTPANLGEAIFPSSLELLLGGSGGGGSTFKAPLPAARRWGLLLQSVSSQAALLIAGNFAVTRLAALSACWLLGEYEAFAAEQRERRRKEEARGRQSSSSSSSSSTARAEAAGAASSGDAAGRRGQGLSARLSASALELLEPSRGAKGPRRQGDVDTVPEGDEGEEGGGGGEGGATDAAADDDDAEAQRPPKAATAPAAHSHEKKGVHGYTSADVLAQMNQLDAYVLLTTPNVFLFAALARGLSSDGGGGGNSGGAAGVLPISDFMLFWALLFFFAAPALEQLLVVKAFMRRAIVNAHSTGVPEGQLLALWETLQAASPRGGGAGGGSSGGGSGGGESSGGHNKSDLARADTARLTALVRQVRRLNTQESLAGRESATTEELDRFTAGELRRAINNDGGVSGSRGGGRGEGGETLLDFESFRRFFRSTGGMINLNRDLSRG